MHLACIDCSNLFIEAQKDSALVRGWTRSFAEVHRQGQIDFGYRLDFERPMTLLRELEDPVRATVYGSVTDSNETLWPHAEAAGFDVRVVERSVSGNEKRVDTGVVTRICRDAVLLGQTGRDHIALSAGDGDYEPMVRELVADSFEVTLLYWPSQPGRGLSRSQPWCVCTVSGRHALRTCRSLSLWCMGRPVGHPRVG